MWLYRDMWGIRVLVTLCGVHLGMGICGGVGGILVTCGVHVGIRICGVLGNVTLCGVGIRICGVLDAGN